MKKHHHESLASPMGVVGIRLPRCHFSLSSVKFLRDVYRLWTLPCLFETVVADMKPRMF